MGKQRPANPELFYDENCGLCNRAVSLIRRLDRRRVIRLVPLESPRARELFREHHLPEDFAEEAVWWDGEALYRGEAAIREALSFLGGFWGWLSLVGRCFPRVFREWVYRVISRRRYGVGRKETCHHSGRE